MKYYLFNTLILFFVCFSAVSAKLLKVPSEFETIQSAIDASQDGDTVLVAEGRYFENIRFKGKGILVGSEYAIDGDPSHILNTIIDGSRPQKKDTASCVLFINNEDSTSVLEGFTLTGGSGTKWTDEHGAGVYYEGGGILVALAAPVIQHNYITDNTAIRTGSGVTSAGGGGIRCGDGNPSIIANIITGNRARYGGGIVMNYTQGIIKNNIITDNSVEDATNIAKPPTFGGGGVWLNQGGTVIIENNTIAGNSSFGTGSAVAGRGGGILVWGTEAVIRNNVVWGNTQENDKQLSGANRAVVEFNNIEDSHTGEGNISENPGFGNTNYILSSGSPCIDAGDPLSEFNDPSESGEAIWPSMGGVRNDIGAYGGPMRTLFPEVITDVDGGSNDQLPDKFYIEQNYPNPFNPSTKIRFSVPANGNVKIEVLDILGRIVSTIYNSSTSAGYHEIEYDASALSAGIYFYRIAYGNLIETRKMIYLK